MTSQNDDRLIQKLRNLKPAFKDMNIRRMAVFGSRARGDARQDSDIDLLVEFIETPDFFEFVATKEKFENLLDSSVDLVTFNALRNKPRHRKILDEAVDV